MASSSCVVSTSSTKKTTTSAFASSSFDPRSSPFSTRPLSSLPPLSSLSSPYPPMSTASSTKRMCMCAPTTHPGSFKCSYHRRLAVQQKNRAAPPSIQSSSTSLNLRRSAMKNSLVRISGVGGELVNRTLTTLIRPSSHELRRQEAFQPSRSRLWMMSKAEE